MSKSFIVGLSLFSALVCSAETLEEGFKSPPASAKPHTWFHMMNGNVTKEGLTRDFEELAKVGIGGVQMFDAGCEIPPGGLDFNSPEWFEMFRHAAAEARRLGLEICIPNCSGWSSSGGPWNPPANAMKEVVYQEVSVTGPSKFAGAVPRVADDNGFYADIGVFAFPVPPACLERFDDVRTELKPDGCDLIAEHPVDISGISFRLAYPWVWMGDVEAVIDVSEDGVAFRRLESFSLPLARSGACDFGMRYHALPGKTRAKALRLRIKSTMRGLHVAEARPDSVMRLSNLSSKTFAMRQEVTRDETVARPDQIVRTGDIRDLTANLKPDGTLAWDVPAGDWRILRIGYRCNGRCNHPASDHGRGLEVDKLSAEAMDYHFERYVSRLCKTLGPLAGNVPTGFNNILVDSFEVGSQNWTQKMEAEFQARRGYSIRPFLPVFAGYIVDSVETSERFLEDFRRVVADLFAENYAGALTRKCHEYGLQCSIEPYGNCPSDNLQYGEHCDIPMGEFWSHAGDPYALGCGNSKFVSHIVHVWGKKFCGTESFTASPSPNSGRWLTTPFSLKAQGDSAFAHGVNRIIYHRYTHQPWAGDDYLPGMTMGRWGMHLDRTQTWWDLSPAWFAYQARCQYLLQEGTFCADVLFFAGEQAPNQGGNTDGSGESAAFARLAPGYDFDICPTDALSALKVVDGRVVVPGGVSYRILALPPMETVSPDLIACVARLRDAGATVVWSKKPVRAPGLKWGAAGDARVRAAADELWAKGVMTCTANEALRRLGVVPDFRVERKDAADVQTIEWIHRRNDEADWYFTAMPNRVETTAEVSFRQTGRIPEVWDAETGTCRPADVWREEGGRTFVTVPYSVCGSKFIVFRRPAADAHVVGCEVKATRRADPEAVDRVRHSLQIRRAQYGVRADYLARENCMSVLKSIKPGKSFVVNNAAFGRDPAPMIPKKLEVVYDLGGERKRDVVAEHSKYALPVGAKLHMAWYGVINSEWKEPKDTLVDVTDKLASRVTDGEISVMVSNDLVGFDPLFLTVKNLFVTYVYDGVEKTAVVEEHHVFRVPEIEVKTPPPPDAFWRDGRLFAFQPLTGKIVSSDGTARDVSVDPPLPIPVSGSWEVSFPNGFLPNRLAKGTPEKVPFKQLASWSDSPVAGVRYFSGTAEYRKVVKAPSRPEGARVELDLGAVRDFAEVCVNGRAYPVLWKPPFRVDVTDALGAAGTDVEIRVKVTNLWANRLIGDDVEHAEDCEWRGEVVDGVKEIAVKAIPQWVKEGRKSPTGRCTFTTWKHWDKNDDLLPSGLLGPVFFRTAVPAGE